MFLVSDGPKPVHKNWWSPSINWLVIYMNVTWLTYFTKALRKSLYFESIIRPITPSILNCIIIIHPICWCCNFTCYIYRHVKSLPLALVLSMLCLAKPNYYMWFVLAAHFELSVWCHFLFQICCQLFYPTCAVNRT